MSFSIISKNINKHLNQTIFLLNLSENYNTDCSVASVLLKKNLPSNGGNFINDIK